MRTSHANADHERVRLTLGLALVAAAVMLVLISWGMYIAAELGLLTDDAALPFTLVTFAAAIVSTIATVTALREVGLIPDKQSRLQIGFSLVAALSAVAAVVVVVGA